MVLVIHLGVMQQVRFTNNDPYSLVPLLPYSLNLISPINKT